MLVPAKSTKSMLFIKIVLDFLVKLAAIFLMIFFHHESSVLSPAIQFTEQIFF